MNGRILAWMVLVVALAVTVVVMAFSSGYRVGADIAVRENGMPGAR